MSAQESEEQLREAAEALFEQEDYQAAFTKYSQLLSLDLQSAEYNFRFGACQLFTINDKEQALKYLKFAVESTDPPHLSHFYYGMGLHLNYRFEKAIKQYEKYQAAAGKKERELKAAPHYIEQCRNGIDLVSSFTDISVVQREALPRTDFYRNYDLSEFGGKIMVKPEDFMSEEDKNRDAKFLMYFQQDADYIYYASYSEKNETGKDLYVIQKLPTGEWSKAKKLSSVINTDYDEDYPFIHPDGNVLYFASKGHNSMGGYDIFKSTRKGDGTWTQPINMEFAINTPWDDFLFISDKEEKTAWFASNRETSGKEVTVYQIGIERVPLDLTLIKGTFEAEGSKKAKITIEDLVQNKVIGVFSSERQFGEYLLDLRGSGNYKFIVEAEESNAIHTGLVEVPREKGLKQFRQEMKLVVNDGQEQLQIINHFDEPITGGESLLTADILRKQASLNVNASEEDIVRTTELLDDPSAEKEAADAGLSNEEKIADVTEKATTLKADADLMNQKAALLFEKAEAKAASEEPADIAESAIAAELANEYKTEADKRSAAAAKMNGTIAVLENNELEEAAFNAQYNQVKTTGENFEERDDFEEQIKSSYDARPEPTLAIYDAKKAEKEELEDDLSSIDEEIAYLKSEIENTKDEALIEEYNLQIQDAEAAKPEKNASIERVTAEFETAKAQKENAETYAALTTSLLAEAAAGAAAVTSSVSASSINALQTSIGTKAASDPALVAFIAPETAKEAAELALAESRAASDNGAATNDGSSDSSTDDSNSENANDIASTTPSSSNSGSEVNESNGSSGTESGSTDISSDEADENSGSSEDASGQSSEDAAEMAAVNAALGNDPNSGSTNNETATNTTAQEDDSTNSPSSSEGDSEEPFATIGTADPASTEEASASTTTETTDINEEIRMIEATESEPEIIYGDYATTFQNQINESANAEDPIIAETRKAEIYDQWVDNLEYRIDSLTTKQDASTNPDEQLELANEIDALTATRDEKDALSLASYEAIAALSDEQANNNIVTEGTSNEGEIAGNTATDEENTALEGASEGSGGSEEGLESGSDIPEGEEELEIPPVTPELLASESVPPTVIQLNSTYTQQLNQPAESQSKVEQLQAEAEINEAWANDLEKELRILSAQSETVESEEDKKAIEQLTSNVAELRLEKQNRAAELKKEASALEKEAQFAESNATLQNQLSEYVESYNGNAFVQIEDQIADIADEEQRFAQTEVLNQNWMVALKNEELKTETRIRNTEDPNVKAELEEKLVKLTAEKLYVQSTLDSLKINENVDGPAAPKSVVIKGSEKFEGYIPVATNKPQQYDELAQASYTNITAKKSEVATLETQLAETKKKKLRPAIEEELEKKQNEVEIAEMESSFYEDAEPKIIGVEPLILQLESGDPTPSQLQMREAEELSMQAANLTTAAVEKRTAAEGIRKKKKRIPALKEARAAEQVALMKRREADLATNLANEMAVIEAEAIANNFIIPAGSAVELPVVSTVLNPTEQADVSNTSQFASYNTERRKADSLRTLALKLATLETQYNNQAQSIMLNPQSLNPGETVAQARVRQTQTAYVIYDKADSLSNEAARLNRQAAFIENDANAALLTNPEEVYNSIIAYYNTDSLPRVAPPSAEELAALAEETNPNVGDAESPIDSDGGQEDPFNLNAPTDATSNTVVDVPETVLTNTIFEVDKTASTSFYSENTPIPVDAPLPSGIIFKVQIGAFRNAIRQDAFKGIKPIVGESTGTGLTRYSAGAFDNFAEADFAKDEIRGIGYSDAFVVAYRNGERISVASARAALTSGGAVAGGATNNNRTGAVATRPLPANSVVKQGSLVVNDVANTSGTFFTVQVGVYSRPVRAADIYNITPLNQEDLPNGTYRYSSGVYNNEGIATQARDEIRGLGISDAFVTAYRSGSRITVDNARQDLGSGGGAPVASGGGSSRINLGTYSGQVPLDQAAVMLSLNAKEIEKVKNPDGSSTYFYGGFDSAASAQQEATRLNGLGLTQAKAEN